MMCFKDLNGIVLNYENFINISGADPGFLKRGFNCTKGNLKQNLLKFSIK